MGNVDSIGGDDEVIDAVRKGGAETPFVRSA